MLLAVLAGCVPPGTTLRQFGIVGTFAEDCSKSIEAGGARAIYDVPATGYAAPTFTAINRYGTFRGQIVRADRIGYDRLVMYIDNPGGAWDEVEIRKTANGFVTTRMVSHKPNQYRPQVAIGEGGLVADAQRGLFVEKCSE